MYVFGEKLFVDYLGNKFGIVDLYIGEICEVELFVVMFGVLNYMYVEVMWI